MELTPTVNVLLTNFCPNKCRYCFAKSMGSAELKGSSFLSLENFLYVLEFHKKSKLTNVRLLGGEPLIHPQIKEILDSIRSDNFFENITIFTGGLYPKKNNAHLTNFPYSFVFNCNNQKNYEDGQYKLLRNNLESVSNSGADLTIGFNIYEDPIDYKEIIGLAVEYSAEAIRLCIANPTIQFNTQVLSWKERKNVGDQIYSLIMECAQNELHIHFDCVLTPCTFTDEQWGRITKIYPNITNGHAICSPALDIDCNLNVHRCFALGETTSVKLSLFKNSKDLLSYFTDGIELIKWFTPKDECKNCIYFAMHRCQGDCLSFRYSEIEPIIKQQPLSNEIFNNAYDALKEGDLLSAICKFEEGLEDYPYDDKVICDYIYSLLKNGAYKKAGVMIEKHKGVLKFYKSGMYFMIMGLIFEHDGYIHESVKWYRKALKKIDNVKKKELIKKIELLTNIK